MISSEDYPESNAVTQPSVIDNIIGLLLSANLNLCNEEYSKIATLFTSLWIIVCVCVCVYPN